jgi:hypothetical protein
VILDRTFRRQLKRSFDEFTQPLGDVMAGHSLSPGPSATDAKRPFQAASTWMRPATLR